jgi:UrcA family protein
MRKTALFTTLAMLCGFWGWAVAETASAQAASAAEVSIKTPSSDLDLSAPAGAKVMLRRIHNAAAQICGPMPSDWLHYGRQYDACIKQTVDRAVARLGAPMVTAMSEGATPVRFARASDRP